MVLSTSVGAACAVAHKNVDAARKTEHGLREGVRPTRKGTPPVIKLSCRRTVSVSPAQLKSHATCGSRRVSDDRVEVVSLLKAGLAHVTRIGDGMLHGHTDLLIGE